MNTLTNEVSLAERQAPADWSSSAGRPLRVQRVDVEGQVNGGVASNMSQGHFDHASDSISEIGVLDLTPFRLQFSPWSREKMGKKGEIEELTGQHHAY